MISGRRAIGGRGAKCKAQGAEIGYAALKKWAAGLFLGRGYWCIMRSGPAASRGVMGAESEDRGLRRKAERLLYAALPRVTG